MYRPLFGSTCRPGGGSGGVSGGGTYYPIRPSTPYGEPGQGGGGIVGQGTYPRPTDCFRIYEANYRLDETAARRSILARWVSGSQEKGE